MSAVIVPAQIRAARALVSWSQEKLATEANVGLSTVRDLEAERRSDEVGAMRDVVQALDNAGVTFLPGSATEGPGVRLCVGLPNIIVRPKGQVQDVLPFTVEHHGKRYIVCLGRAPLEDLAPNGRANTDEVRLATFEKYRRAILERAARAIENNEAKPDGRVYLGTEHFSDHRRVGP